jgi:hypothetical protein
MTERFHGRRKNTVLQTDVVAIGPNCSTGVETRVFLGFWVREVRTFRISCGGPSEL